MKLSDSTRTAGDLRATASIRSRFAANASSSPPAIIVATRSSGGIVGSTFTPARVRLALTQIGARSRRAAGCSFGLFAVDVLHRARLRDAKPASPCRVVDEGMRLARFSLRQLLRPLEYAAAGIGVRRQPAVHVDGHFHVLLL